MNIKKSKNKIIQKILTNDDKTPDLLILNEERYDRKSSFF